MYTKYALFCSDTECKNDLIGSDSYLPLDGRLSIGHMYDKCIEHINKCLTHRTVKSFKICTGHLFNPIVINKYTI